LAVQDNQQAPSETTVAAAAAGQDDTVLRTKHNPMRNPIPKGRVLRALVARRTLSLTQQTRL
jgi:hypothetical protein